MQMVDRCAVCSDTGLLIPGMFCPLCDGHGFKNCRLIETSKIPSERGRIYVERMMRTGIVAPMTGTMTSDVKYTLMSKKQRRKYGADVAASSRK